MFCKFCQRRVMFDAWHARVAFQQRYRKGVHRIQEVIKSLEGTKQKSNKCKKDIIEEGIIQFHKNITKIKFKFDVENT